MRPMIINKSLLIGGCIILFLIIMGIIGPNITPHDPIDPNVHNKLQGPSTEHWFGTDHQGRDILSRIVHGTHITFYVGFVSVTVGASIGILFGLLAGYYAGWIDALLMRIVDVLLAFPGILLALAIISVLGPSLTNVMIAVGIFSVPIFARVVRGSTLEVRQMDYIQAITALGAGDRQIIVHHILPNILSPIIVHASLRMATAILTASGLSFLGMGAQPPTPEWGAMLSEGRNYLWTAPHTAFFPGMAIMLTVLGFNIFGDGLRDALDPRLRR